MTDIGLRERTRKSAKGGNFTRFRLRTTLGPTEFFLKIIESCALPAKILLHVKSLHKSERHPFLLSVVERKSLQE